MNGSGSATDGYNWDAFGNLMSRFGSNPTMFAWNEASGYQTDSDDGLTLLGHRYYDKRTGRFISQDPAGSGDNWYKYASNNPMNRTDPSGLSDGLPGSLGAPDSHYGGLGGVLDGDPGGLFGGESYLNEFFAAQDAETAHGQARYLAAEAAVAAAHHKRYYHQWLNAPGTVWNNSSYSIPIMFDHDTKTGGKIFYEMTLPPHTYTGLEDIDFVYWANDPQQPGGYDWRHIAGDTNVIIQNSGSGISTSGIFYPGSFKGYPFNVTPIPVSGNTSIEIFSIPRPAIPPLLVGPIP